MIQSAISLRAMTLSAMLIAVSGGAVLAADYPVAGTAPAERLANAPVTTEYPKNGAWYEQALRGVERPYPHSLRFLEDQGGWHTPFNRPGMTNPYDIRGWHQTEAAVQYDAARWDPIHFKPAIDSATNEQCLACHREVIDRRVHAQSPAGLRSEDVLAWYQTLDTYSGEQDTFHRRHLVSEYATEVMDLKCNTCHQGNDPREETANSSATGDATLIQRKHVDPQICLMCHGEHNAVIMGLPPGDWRETGAMFNGNCLTCHAAIRTNRHQVNFLKPEAIEKAAQERMDVCFGCHGGRSWYRIPYPYPRHAWPGAGTEIPDWAKDRPTESPARFRTSAQ